MNGDPKKKLAAALKILVSGALILVVYRKMEFAPLAEKLGGANPWHLLFAFLFLFLNTLISSVKWRILLKADGLGQSLWSLFSSHLIGSFLSLFLPSTIGGDAYRVADIGGKTSKHARTFASVLADRMTGFMALAVYGTVSAFFVRDRIQNWDGRFLLIPVLCLCALAALAAVLLYPKMVLAVLSAIPGRLPEKAKGLVLEISSAMRVYFSDKAALLKAIALSFLFQLDIILFIWAVTASLGLGIPFFAFFVFVPFITFLEMMPISVFGLGFRDMGYRLFLGAVAVSGVEESTAAVTLLYMALTVLYLSLGGVLLAFRKTGR